MSFKFDVHQTKTVVPRPGLNVTQYTGLVKCKDVILQVDDLPFFLTVASSTNTDGFTVVALSTAPTPEGKKLIDYFTNVFGCKPTLKYADTSPLINKDYTAEWYMLDGGGKDNGVVAARVADHLARGFAPEEIHEDDP